MFIYSTLLPNFTFFFVSLLSHIIFMSLILSVPLLTHQSIPLAQKEIVTQTTPLIFEEERGVFFCIRKMRSYQIEIYICLSQRKILSLSRNSLLLKETTCIMSQVFSQHLPQSNTDGSAEPCCSHHYLLPAHKNTVAK